MVVVLSVKKSVDFPQNSVIFKLVKHKQKTAMKLNDRSFKVFIYSGLGVSIPILAVGVAMLLSGYRISPEAKFWLWFVVVLSAVVMVFSLIRLLCDFIPVDKISRRLRKNVVSVQDNSLKQAAFSQSNTNMKHKMKNIQTNTTR